MQINTVPLFMNSQMIEIWTGRTNTNFIIVVLSEEGERERVVEDLKR